MTQTATRPTSITIQLPVRFYDDHVERELPAGIELRRTKRYVTVELTRADYDEVLNDADYYGDPFGPTEIGPGLKRSAITTAQRLRAAEPPVDDFEDRDGRAAWTLTASALQRGSASLNLGGSRELFVEYGQGVFRAFFHDHAATDRGRRILWAESLDDAASRLAGWLRRNDSPTVTVDIAPAAWEGAELWTSFPPVNSDRVRVGRHLTYRLSFEIPVAEQLLDHCQLGWEGGWDASAHEKHAYRDAARRLKRALDEWKGAEPR